MKKTYAGLIFTIVSSSISAQKTDKVSVDYEMTMYPRNLITKGNTVDIQVSSNYEDLVKRRQDEIEEIKTREDGKSTGQKIFQQVSGMGPNVGAQIDAIIVPTLVGETSVSSVKVDGFSESNDAKGKIQLVFHPLDYTTGTNGGYQYYAQKVDVTIYNDKDVMLQQITLPAMKTTRTYTPGVGEKQRDSYYKMEKMGKEEAIRNVNDFLKKEYAYTKVKDERRFYDVKDKKQHYPEYHKAIEKVKTYFAYMTLGNKKEEQEAAMKEAVSIWEAELHFLDKSNKDARINKDIAAATYLNLAEAYIWLNDFDKAKAMLVEYKLLDEDYSRTESGIIKFLEDYSKRVTGYNTY